MTDRLERDLTTLFESRAASTPAPPVPLERLVREGEAATAAGRQRTRVIAVAAVAAAVALAAATPLLFRGGDSDAPQPTDVPTVTNTSTERPERVADLPEGPLPTVPYVLDGVLHLDGEEYPLPAGKELDFNGADGSTVSFTDPFKDEPWGLRGGELVLIEDELAGERSHDGTLVATLDHEGGERPRIALHDVTSGDEIAHVVSPLPATRVYPRGIDGQGRVFWTQQGQGTSRDFVWAPSERPRRLSLPAGAELVDVGPRGVVVGFRGLEFHFGAVSADGRFSQGSRLPVFAEWQVGAPLSWSENGRFMAGNTAPPPPARGGFTVVDVISGRTIDVLLPEDVANFSTLVTFEGSRNVIVQVGVGRVGYSLRCSVRTGACDRLPFEPGRDEATVPDFGSWGAP